MAWELACEPLAAVLPLAWLCTCTQNVNAKLCKAFERPQAFGLIDTLLQYLLTTAGIHRIDVEAGCQTRRWSYPD